MALSSDKANTLLETMSTYFFKDLDDDESVSFVVLPVRWTDEDGSKEHTVAGAAVKETVFLHGTTDNGLRKIYREIKSWKGGHARWSRVRTATGNV
ncbi:hypothetical protein ACJRO7_017100 [Eucalyptus globulus]|uniref:Uncharacterized protein n=1 Tax=Eucalyptus globulus TaxID=34317 RepID=A0ABD3KW78_EUCGL